MGFLSENATLITTLSSAGLSGLASYFIAGFTLPNITGTANLPFGSNYSGQAAVGWYSALGSLAGAALDNYAIPMLPSGAQDFVGGLGKSVVEPGLAGLSTYGITMMAAPDLSSNAALSLFLTGALGNFVGASVARAWQPFLADY